MILRQVQLAMRMMSVNNIGYCFERPPYWTPGVPEKIHNPKANEVTEHSLNLKHPCRGGLYMNAINYFAGPFANLVNKTLGARGWWPTNTYLVVIPSSTVGNTSEGLSEIARRTQERTGVQFVPNALIRHTQIDKLATGGSRTVDVHLKSIHCQLQLPPQSNVIIFDDIVTSGNSMIACNYLINSKLFGCNTVALALSKTV